MILQHFEALQEKKKSKKGPLEVLEGWRYNDDYVKRQVGFCSQWTLDNLCMFLTASIDYLILVLSGRPSIVGPCSCKLAFLCLCH